MMMRAHLEVRRRGAPVAYNYRVLVPGRRRPRRLDRYGSLAWIAGLSAIIGFWALVAYLILRVA